MAACSWSLHAIARDVVEVLSSPFDQFGAAARRRRPSPLGGPPSVDDVPPADVETDVAGRRDPTESGGRSRCLDLFGRGPMAGNECDERADRSVKAPVHADVVHRPADGAADVLVDAIDHRADEYSVCLPDSCTRRIVGARTRLRRTRTSGRNEKRGDDGDVRHRRKARPGAPEEKAIHPRRAHSLNSSVRDERRPHRGRKSRRRRLPRPPQRGSIGRPPTRTHGGQ